MSKQFKELVCAKRGNQPARQFFDAPPLAMKINEIVNATLIAHALSLEYALLRIHEDKAHFWLKLGILIEPGLLPMLYTLGELEEELDLSPSTLGKAHLAKRSLSRMWQRHRALGAKSLYSADGQS